VEEDGLHLVGREDDGELGGLLGALDVLDELERLVEDFAVEEEEGAEGLILRGCGDVALDGEMSEETADVLFGELSRVTTVVEENVLADPAYVGLLGADAVVTATEGGANVVEKSGLGHETPLAEGA
jgi:hypothetical protein